MPVSTPSELAWPRASLGRRCGALLYEALLVIAIVFVTSFIALPLISPGHAGSAQALTIPAVTQRVVLFFLLFGGLAWYFVWSWTGRHRTLPMKTWRLCIVAADGQPPSRKTALLRYLAAWIGPALALIAFTVLHPYALGANAAWLLGFNFLWAFVDPDRQFLHDRLAGTRLVGEPRTANPSGIPPVVR